MYKENSQQQHHSTTTEAATKTAATSVMDPMVETFSIAELLRSDCAVRQDGDVTSVLSRMSAHRWSTTFASNCGHEKADDGETLTVAQAPTTEPKSPGERARVTMAQSTTQLLLQLDDISLARQRTAEEEGIVDAIVSGLSDGSIAVTPFSNTLAREAKWAAHEG